MKNDQMTDLQRKSTEAAKQLAQLSLDNSQRILALQTELVQQMFTDGLASAKSLLQAKDPKELLDLQTRYAQDMAQKLVAASQKVSAVGNEAREQLTSLMTGQMAQGGEFKNVFQDFFKLPPAGTTDFTKVVQQAMTTANQAFEQMAKASTAAFANFGEAAKPSGKKSGK